MYSTKLIYSNPFVTEEMAEKIAKKVFGLTYMPCNVKWRGNPSIQAGDAVRVVDRSGVRHTVLVMQQTTNFGGGLNSNISCPGETGEECDGSMTTPTGQKISAASGQLDADLKQYISEVNNILLEEVKEYTDTAIAQAVNECKEYTDNAISELKLYIDEQIKNIQGVE